MCMVSRGVPGPPKEIRSPPALRTLQVPPATKYIESYSEQSIQSSMNFKKC